MFGLFPAACLRLVFGARVAFRFSWWVWTWLLLGDVVCDGIRCLLFVLLDFAFAIVGWWIGG